MPKYRRTLEHRGLSDSDYMSIMEKVANENYTNWGFNNPDEALLYALNDNTYNYRGYYDKYPKGKGNAIDHWTDEFKTVYHPTFSNESKYNGKVDSNFNPNGFTGGMWLNDIYIPPKYQSKSKIKFASGGKVKSSFVRSLETQPTILEQVAERDKEKQREQLRSITKLKNYITYNGDNIINRNTRDYLTPSNSSTKVYRGRKQNIHLNERGVAGAKSHAIWEKEHPNLASWSNIAASVPFAIASAPLINVLGNTAASSLAGQSVTKGLTFLSKAIKANPIIAKTLPYIDAGITSYATTDGFNKLAKGDYSPEAFLEALGGYGAVLSAPTRYVTNEYSKKYISNQLNINRIKPIRKLNKAYRRLSSDSPSYYYIGRNGVAYQEDMANIANNIARRQAEILHGPSPADKEAFKSIYKNALNRSVVKDVEANMAYSGLKEFNVEDADRLYNIFQRNPEYYVHVKENNIKNPLSQEAINSFINRQLTSIRGVSAPDKATAINYLTSTQKGRIRSGGDRLGSKGGLYVSNNPMISDRFKNPVGGSIENGYVGILKEPDFIDRNLSIEQQLKYLRDRTEFAGTEEPLYGTIFLGNLDKSNVHMLESRYVGNANRGTGGYERVYLPSNIEGKTEYPVGIEKLDEYLHQVDTNGRWGYGLPASSDKRLFIAKQLNAHDDFIKRARAVLKPHKDIDKDKYYSVRNILDNEAINRNHKRLELIRKLDANRFKYNKLKSNRIPYSIATILAGGMGYAAYRNQKASGGSIHIAPSKRGTFTAAASKHCMGV